MTNDGRKEQSKKRNHRGKSSSSATLSLSHVSSSSPLSSFSSYAKPVTSATAGTEEPSLASSVSSASSHQLRVAFVSDFCYPCLGGVEFHQYFLAQCLRRLGHHVILITGTYGSRRGIRYLTEGLKVYYLPILVSKQHVGFPTFFANFPLLRSIWITERIQIVHGHQSTSSLAHEALFHARTMGLTTVYTDHSLFTLHSFESLHLNELMSFTLCECARIITVSHTSKENICVRCKSTVQPSRVAVIPNAVNSSDFCPPDISGVSSLNEGIITIVVLSRLVYRKGVDLLIDVIPSVCKRYSNVRFIIGGDGPKRLLLEEMREKFGLHERVELLGSIPHDQVRSVLIRGQIFLNCSLTEAFCIAILEAISCGLLVVSTKVGGVPEIMPTECIHFAVPVAADLEEKCSEAVERIQCNDAIPPWKLHEMVNSMYNWSMVALRTEACYREALLVPKVTIAERFFIYFPTGPLLRFFFLVLSVIDYIFYQILEGLSPRISYDEAVDLSVEDWLRYESMQPDAKI